MNLTDNTITIKPKKPSYIYNNVDFGEDTWYKYDYESNSYKKTTKEDAINELNKVENIYHVYNGNIDFIGSVMNKIFEVSDYIFRQNMNLKISDFEQSNNLKEEENIINKDKCYAYLTVSDSKTEISDIVDLCNFNSIENFINELSKNPSFSSIIVEHDTITMKNFAIMIPSYLKELANINLDECAKIINLNNDIILKKNNTIDGVSGKRDIISFSVMPN